MKDLNVIQLSTITGGAAALNCDQILALVYLRFALGDIGNGNYWMSIYALACNGPLIFKERLT
jgi:hypothetical protein